MEPTIFAGLLLDILPGTSMNNSVDRGYCNFKLFCNGCLAHTIRIFSAYGKYLLGGKFGRANFLAPWLSALIHLVIHIVFGCAKKQVIRVDTRGVVAAMQYPQTFRDWAKMNFPTQSMNKLKRGSNSDSGVATRLTFALPKPALVGFSRRDVRPEYFCGGVDFMPMSDNEPFWLAFNPAAPRPTNFSYRGFLSAAAHTQAARIWLFGRTILERVMLSNKAHGLTSDPTLLLMGLWGKLGLFATSTGAISVEDFLRGIMELHKKFTFLVSNPGTRYRALPGTFYWGYCCFIIADLNEYHNYLHMEFQ